MGNCPGRMQDAQLVSSSNKKAKKMGLLTNDEVFAHELNVAHSTSKDPRTQQQVDAKAEFGSEGTAPDSPTDAPKQNEEIGFITTPDKMRQSQRGSDLLPDESSREGYNLNKKPIHLWQDMEIVIALGHKRLTIEADGSVIMSFKDIADTPPESRWKFVKVKKEENKDPDAAGEDDVQPAASIYTTSEEETCWHIMPVTKPGWALTCALAPKAVAKVAPLQMGSSDQVFRYNADGNLLPGPATQDTLALWVKGDEQSIVIAIPRSAEGKKDKKVEFTNKKGQRSSKMKKVHVEVDVTRRLKWSILPEDHHLVMLPRILRTTHAHSPFFRVTGEEARAEELQRGGEERQPLVGERLIAYSPLLPYIMGAAEGSWQKDKFWALCQLLGCPLVDRSGKLDCPMKFKILHPIPSKGEDPGPLGDLMKNRARQLLDQHMRGTGNLNVLWSGGIDTTAVVVAFMQVAQPHEKQRIVIRYCTRSVAEYPLFFNNFIKNEFPCQEIQGHVRDAFQDGPTITGDPADMLMGTLVCSGAFKGREHGGQKNVLHFALDQPWDVVIPKWMFTRGLVEDGKAARDDWLAWMDPFVKASPVPIITVFDWLWWVTYACKYQHDLLRVFYNRQTIPEELRWNVINFFEPDEFHRWSFHHHAEKMPDKSVWASYKLPLKDYIHAHTGDDLYRAAKMKVQSVRNSWGFELAITDQWEVIRFGTYSVSIRRMREKYGRDLDRFLEPSMLQKREAQTEFGSDYMPLAAAAAVTAGGAFLTLAAFRGAEVFDPSRMEHPKEAKDHGSGAGTQFQYMGE